MATVILFIHGWLESCSFQYVFFFASFFLSIDYCSVLLQWRKPIHVLICILACRFCFQTFPLYTCFDQKRRKKKGKKGKKKKQELLCCLPIFIFSGKESRLRGICIQYLHYLLATSAQKLLVNGTLSYIVFFMENVTFNSRGSKLSKSYQSYHI